MVCYFSLSSCTLLGHCLVDIGILKRFEGESALIVFFRLVPAYIALFMQVETDVAQCLHICACSKGLSAEASFLS